MGGFKHLILALLVFAAVPSYGLDFTGKWKVTKFECFEPADQLIAGQIQLACKDAVAPARFEVQKNNPAGSLADGVTIKFENNRSFFGTGTNDLSLAPKAYAYDKHRDQSHSAVLN